MVVAGIFIFLQSRESVRRWPLRHAGVRETEKENMQLAQGVQAESPRATSVIRGDPLRGDSEPGVGSETVARGAPLRTGACPGVVESGTVLVWSI